MLNEFVCVVLFVVWLGRHFIGVRLRRDSFVASYRVVISASYGSKRGEVRS
jgi:hypothetical protein